MICHWCREPLIFVVSRGWIHVGGGTYVQRCDPKMGGCGWKGSRLYFGPFHHNQYWTCPECKTSIAMVDDHCALPDTHAAELGL